MKEAVIRLLEVIEELRGQEAPYNFEVRVRVERAIFQTASSLSLQYLDHDLAGFSGESRGALERLHIDGDRARHARNVVFRAFELKAVLQALTSGSSYIEGELRDSLAPGQRKMGMLFLRRLEAYARFLSDFAPK